MRHHPSLAVAFTAVALVARTALADQLPVAATNTPDSSMVTVELALLEPPSLRLKYRLPATCRQLPLRSPYPESLLNEMRKAWRPANGCGAEKDGIIVRSDRQCDATAC